LGQLTFAFIVAWGFRGAPVSEAKGAKRNGLFASADHALAGCRNFRRSNRSWRHGSAGGISLQPNRLQSFRSRQFLPSRIESQEMAEIQRQADISRDPLW
jgi:hypothetical protein